MTHSIISAPSTITHFTGQRAHWKRPARAAALALAANSFAKVLLLNRKAMNTRIAIAGFLAASIAAASAASITVVASGSINGNARVITEATGNSMNATTFASDIATAFANDTGGVWDFDGAGFGVDVGETITLNYGTSQTKSLVLTLGGSNGINQATNIGTEPTSGATGLGLGGDGSTRVFTLSTPMSSIGIFSLDRNDSGRIPVLTVTFLDDTTASTSGANADNTYFHGLSSTGTNYIKSFSLTQNNFVRYDDLGFIAVPEPSSAAMLLLGGLGVTMLSRRRNGGMPRSHSPQWNGGN